MVKYTRRHFQEISALISKVPKAQRREEAERYANMFRADNPRFDKGKFMAACKLDAENVGKYLPPNFKAKFMSGVTINRAEGSATLNKANTDFINKSISNPSKAKQFNMVLDKKGLSYLSTGSGTSTIYKSAQLLPATGGNDKTKSLGNCGCKGKGKAKKKPKKIGNLNSFRATQWEKVKSSGMLNDYTNAEKRFSTATDKQLANLRGFAKTLTPEDRQYHKSYASYSTWQLANTKKQPTALTEEAWRAEVKKNMTGGLKAYAKKQNM
jgi:hypothetical protein